MAVSKRTRFEVLRRDNHSCRYCGQCAPDVKLTVDHVVPKALGGTDAPSNLVAACVDCNVGKASSSPDAALVSDVAADALQWAAALKLAGERASEARKAEQASLTHFKEHVWDVWVYGTHEKTYALPLDWEEAIRRQLEAGLTMSDLTHAVKVTMTNDRVRVNDEFRYFMGVCRGILADRAAEARAIIASGEV